MNQTQQLIEDVKKSLGVQSDYAVAKALGVTFQRISSYRTGRTQFDNLMAYKVAEVIGMDPAEAVARINLDRAKRPEDKKAWRHILKQLTSTAAALVLLLQGLLGSPADAIAQPAQGERANTGYYVK